MSDPVELRDVWNWLPTFRVVAETEHLPTASEHLHVTPAAISRTIGLLEDRLGRSLFNRTGKRLALNADGRALLARIQEAMNSVERGLSDLDEDPFSGPVTVSSVGVLTNHYVVPALLELAQHHPQLEPRARNLSTRDAAEALLRGAVDVAFIYEPMTLEGIHVEQLATSPSSLYCGRGHPLFEADNPELDDLLEHPFSVPQIGDTGQVMDGWPADVPRTVGMRITLLTSNLEVCLSGQFLTVLPDVTARRHVEHGQLRRFDVDVVSATKLFAARRESDDDARRARGVVYAVRQRAKRLEEQLAEYRREY